MDDTVALSKSMWNREEAVQYLEEAAGDDVEIDYTAGGDNEIAFKWHGMNRMEIFTTLIEHGWGITSMYGGVMWLQYVGSPEYDAIR